MTADDWNLRSYSDEEEQVASAYAVPYPSRDGQSVGCVKKGFERWLDPFNFESNGRQRRRLEDCRIDVRRARDGQLSENGWCEQATAA